MTTRENNKFNWKAVVLVVITILGSFQSNVGGYSSKVAKTAITQEA